MQTATIKTEVITFNNWTLRVRQSTIEKPKVLVMIHGFTGDENSMWVFARRLSAPYWMIAPRAPHPTQPFGFSWRPPHAEMTFGCPSLDLLYPSAEALIKLIDEYSASLKIEAQEIDLMGFSQGGAMVNVLGFLYPNRIRKMAVLAGFVPSGLDEYIEKKTLTEKNIFVFHGKQDEMITIDRARTSVELLKQAGANVNFVEEEVGHKLGVNGLRALEEYFAD